jgi:hypothetical protein
MPFVQLVAVHATAASTTGGGPPASRPASTVPPELLLLLLLLLETPELLLLLLETPPELLLPPVPESSPVSPAGFASPPQPEARTLTTQTLAPNAANKAILMTFPLGACVDGGTFAWTSWRALSGDVSHNRLRSVNETNSGLEE